QVWLSIAIAIPLHRLAAQHQSIARLREDLSQTHACHRAGARPLTVEGDAHEARPGGLESEFPGHISRLVEERSEEVPCNRGRILRVPGASERALPDELRWQLRPHRV